uniref:Uncharacterized protein n=1 Tax=Plectus sambesii TaxID=2011161 RepID=A0A914W2Z7_9BILA
MVPSYKQKSAKTSSASVNKDNYGTVSARATDASSSVEDVAQCSSKSNSSAEHDAQLREKAKLALLREAKRGAERSETMGTQGWRPPTSYATNKRFLSRTLASTMSQPTKYNKEQSRKRQRSVSPKEERKKPSI